MRTTLDDPVDMHDVLCVDGPCTQKVIVAKRARDDDDLVLDQQMPECLEGFVEQPDFDAPCVVVEDDADAVAALAHVDDQSGDRHFATGLGIVTIASAILRRRLGRQVTETPVDEKPCIVTHGVERVAGQVQAERLLLVA